MNVRYLEIDSTYRDRNRWPLPGEFEIPISQTGRKSQLTAIDPVTLAAPINAWTSNFVNATGLGTTITMLIAANSCPDILYVTATAGQMQQEYNYYKSLVANDTTIGARRSILSYTYLGTDAGAVNDRGLIRLSSPLPDNFNVGDTIVITDTTDLSNVSFPLLFIPAGVSGENSYNNCIIYNESLNQSRVTAGYNNKTSILTINTSPSGGGPVTGWLPTHNYNIRKIQPGLISSVGVGSTANTIVIIGGSTVNDELNGQFVRIRGNLYGNSIVAPQGEIRRIVDYDGATTTAIVSPAFSGTPIAATIIEILPFSFDNLNPFVYTGSLVSQQEMVCYEIELVNLILPNESVDVGHIGGRIAFYPYVYVEISNISGTSSGIKNVIYSNNPNASRMVFRAAVSDIENPNITSFIKLDGGGMVQTLKFKPNDNLKFSVRMATGEVYNTIINDFNSPYPPNPLAQISALFSLKRL